MFLGAKLHKIFEITKFLMNFFSTFIIFKPTEDILQVGCG